MARRPLPDDLTALRVLLGQVNQFLGAAEPFHSKLRMQQSLIRRAIQDPDDLLANRSYAAHLQEEIYKSGAALEFPGRLLGGFLDEDEGRTVPAPEDPDLGPADTLSAEAVDQYRRLCVGVREMGDLIRRHTRLAGEILVKMAAMTAASAIIPTKFRVDMQEGMVEVDGRTFPLDDPDLAFLKALEMTAGGWVSRGKMSEEFRVLEGVRVDRRIRKLPHAIRELVEAEPGKGYRLRVDLLA